MPFHPWLRGRCSPPSGLAPASPARVQCAKFSAGSVSRGDLVHGGADHASDHLARAERNREDARRPLRFIRSTSASLPPQIMQALERLRLSGHRILWDDRGRPSDGEQSPRPPRQARPGGGERGAGGGIKGPDGGLCRPAGRGRSVRGQNVTTGYANNPANAEAYRNGCSITGAGFSDPRHLPSAAG
jgi:hypothetical protein